MAALFHHTAMIHDDDPVGLLHGRQPVGDDQTGAARHGAMDSVLNQTLVLGVQRAGGFVQQQDRRGAHECAGNGQPLTLAAGQRAARSPMGVSKPCGSLAMKLAAWAAIAAALTSRWLALSRPKRMFSDAEPENMAGSCDTMARRLRTSAGSAWRRSTPSMLTEPEVGS